MRMRIYKLFAAALLVLLCVNLLPGGSVRCGCRLRLCKHPA